MSDRYTQSPQLKPPPPPPPLVNVLSSCGSHWRGAVWKNELSQPGGELGGALFPLLSDRDGAHFLNFLIQPFIFKYTNRCVQAQVVILSL